MKTVTIDLNNKEKIMLVEVPEDAYDFSTTYEDKYSFLRYKQTSIARENPYGGGFINEDQHGGCFLETSRSKGVPEIEILGTYLPRTGVINFNDLVKREWVEPRSRLTDTYTDYTQEMSVGFQDYEDSFISLLKTETEKAFPLKENPFKTKWRHGHIPKEQMGNIDEYTKKWQESESKVMPHKFVVLMVKNAT